MGCQVLGQGLLLQAADAAEEVNLPALDADAHAERVAVLARQLAALARRRCGHAHLRQLLRTLDLVERTGLLDVEHGHAQVTVVVQRSLDQLLQPRIREEVLPRNVGSRLLAGDGGHRVLVCGDCGGLVQLRDQ